MFFTTLIKKNICSLKNTFKFSLRIILLLLISFSIFECSKKTPPSTSTTPPKTTPNQVTHVTPKEKEVETTKPKSEKRLPAKVDEKIQYFITHSSWVDSVFNTLTPEERIAQLIMFDAYSNMPSSHMDSLMSLVKKHKIGGLIFFQGGPGRQINMINKLQSASKVPLLIAMDAENGIGMRLDSTNKYPFQMTLGALSDDKLIYAMGKAIALDIKRVGMHVNFAPVLDINSNSENPVIGIRSFGENKHAVTAKSLAYMRGLQDYGVLATAKHFPGHGDTHVDSHLELPLVNVSRKRLDTLELFPFKELIKQGLGGIMIAHMNIPALDPTEKLPSTLSKKIVTDLLKKDLGFKGLIFTDAMVMEGVAKYYPSGVAEPLAVIAGNEMLEKMKNAKVAIKAIKAAVDKGDIRQEDIDEKCRKILAVKYWVGLNNFKPISKENIYNDLKNKSSDSLITKIIEASATLLQNKQNSIPIKSGSNLKIATLSINSNETNAFQKRIGESIEVEHFNLSIKSPAKTIAKLASELNNYDIVIIGLHDNRNWPGYKFGYSRQLFDLIADLSRNNKAIITLFGSPYTLNGFSNIEDARGLLVMYENTPFTHKIAADILLGKIRTKGKLPVTVNESYKIGSGIVD